MTTTPTPITEQAYYRYEITRYSINHCGEFKPTWTEVIPSDIEYWYSLEGDKSTGIYYPVGDAPEMNIETELFPFEPRLSCEKIEIGEPTELMGIPPPESGAWDEFRMPDMDGYPGGEEGYFEQTKYAYSMSAWKCCGTEKYIDITTNKCMQFVTTSEKYTGGDFGSGATPCEVVGDPGSNPASVCQGDVGTCVPYCPKAYAGSLGGDLNIRCDEVDGGPWSISDSFTGHRVPFPYPMTQECGGCPGPMTDDVIDNIDDMPESEGASMQMSETFDVTPTPIHRCHEPINPDGPLTYTSPTTSSHGEGEDMYRLIHFHFDDNSWLPFNSDGTGLLWEDVERIKATFPIPGADNINLYEGGSLWHDVHSITVHRGLGTMVIDKVVISVYPPKNVELAENWWGSFHGQTGYVDGWEHSFDPFDLESQCEIPPTWTKTSEPTAYYNFNEESAKLVQMPVCGLVEDFTDKGYEYLGDAYDAFYNDFVMMDGDGLEVPKCPIPCMCNPPPPPHCPGNPECGECPGSPGCCEPCSGGSSIQSVNCCGDPHVTTFFGEKYDM